MSFDQVAVDIAKRRGIVSLADGRTARLVHWPALPSPGYRKRSRGARAVVLLPSGAHLSVPCEEVRW